MVVVQNWQVFQLFFLGNIGQENDIFPKGLAHGFVPKMAILPPFFLGNIGQENVFDDILERKNAFLG